MSSVVGESESAPEDGWTVVDAQVPGNELVIVDRGVAVQGRSVTRLRPSRYGAAVRELAAQATRTREGIDRTLIRRGVRERQIARVTLAHDGVVHSVAIWVGPDSLTPPAAPRAGAWTWDLQTRCTRWTRALFELYGVSAGTHRPLNGVQEFLQKVYPDDALAIAKLLNEADGSEPNQLLGRSFTVQLPDESLRTLHGFGRVLIDDQGKRTWRGTSIDISGYRGAELPPRTVLGTLNGSSRTHTALVTLPHCHLLRWLSADPMDVSWPSTGELQLAFHPDDRLQRGLLPAEIAKLPPNVASELSVRIRTKNGAYEKVRVQVQLLDDIGDHAVGIMMFIWDDGAADSRAEVMGDADRLTSGVVHADSESGAEPLPCT
ncbi:GAF domain-containing protein [Rhodococcus qingshengii]|uniref:GAF domain-containing protein n=1 Tax=Rhodococcus qingshengii TaxID=334542 RepID=UPI0021B12F55|nr:GAF domain-containing protein [Rhodococcus qingshengii]MCT6736586.1 DUF5593 domain-containing protein [Rhodococcus qingshengii]